MNKRDLDVHVTIGPSSRGLTRLAELLGAHVSAVRLNMSYANHSDLAKLIDDVRRIAPHIKIGADLKGRKLRIGSVTGGKVKVRKGDKFTLVSVADDTPGGSTYATVKYPDMVNSLSVDSIVLLDDASVSMKVDSFTGNSAECTVLYGGEITDGCGINFPGCTTNIAALTEKDYHDLDILKTLDIDHVYLSYVEGAQDMILLKNALNQRGLAVRVIAKVELAVAVNNINWILDESDAICIARGDLGVEVPYSAIPFVQRELVRAAKAKAVPVLLAGELMLSLVERMIPYRAEVTDLVTAIEQGVDGFILSDETAIGINPANAANVIHTVCAEVFKRSSASKTTIEPLAEPLS